MKTQQLAIGVDVGATKIAAVLADNSGYTLLRMNRPTQPERGAIAVIHAIGDIIQEMLSRSPRPVTGIGIDTPGQVNPIDGIVRGATNLGWDEVSLVEELQGYLNIQMPIYVIRDAYAELLGEAYLGNGQGIKDLVYLGLGSGLGGGAMSNGHLITGATLNASEIGHLSLDRNGRLCKCGLYGCAETVVSGNGIVETTQQWMQNQSWQTILPDASDLTAADIIHAAKRNDDLATAVINKAAQWLGQIIATYAIILNPSRVIIGGGFGKAAFSLLIPNAKEELKRTALDMNCQELQILPSTITSSALGASCLVWHSQASTFQHKVTIN